VCFELAALDPAHQLELGAELFRLPTGQPRELGAADPLGEAEKVLDPRRVRGLAPGYIPVADERRQAVGGRVDGGSEARRPGADDDEIVMGLLRRMPAVPGHHDLLDGRTGQRSLDVDEDGQGRIDQPETLEQGVGLGRPRLVPFVRLCRPRQEVANAVVLSVHPPTHDLYRWTNRAHLAR